jgi:hypothetical protein
MPNAPMVAVEYGEIAGDTHGARRSRRCSGARAAGSCLERALSQRRAAVEHPFQSPGTVSAMTSCAIAAATGMPLSGSGADEFQATLDGGAWAAKDNRHGVGRDA